MRVKKISYANKNNKKKKLRFLNNFRIGTNKNKYITYEPVRVYWETSRLSNT